MKIIKIDYNHPNPAVIKQVACLINKGKIAVVPGDAVYTIVGDAFRRDAIQKILKVKRRNQVKPFNLGLYCLDDIALYGQFNSLLKEIAKQFPKEPFTFVVPRGKNVPGFLNPGCKTLGFRVPFNKVTSCLSKFHRSPVIGTSANISELKNTYSVEEFMEYFRGIWGREFQPDIVLDAGKLPRRRPSTVIELIGNKVNILREGEISSAVLEKEIKRLIEAFKKKNHEGLRY